LSAKKTKRLIQTTATVNQPGPAAVFYSRYIISACPNYGKGNIMHFEYRSKPFDIEGVSQNDHIYKNICRSGTFYEIDLLQYIYRLKPFFQSKKHNNVVVDVGANIGNHSVFFGSFIADHLIAVEPNPDVLPSLRRNLSKNVRNYTLCEYAVGEKEGRGTIDVPQNMAANIGAAKVNLQNSNGDIEVLTLDSVISSCRKNENNSISVSLIKIDVEGMESQVLKGAEKTILEYKPHIFAEAATKEELERIHNYLQSLGYRKLPGHWATTPVYHFAYNPIPGFRPFPSLWNVTDRYSKNRITMFCHTNKINSIRFIDLYFIVVDVRTQSFIPFWCGWI
jgi:FkbM family methyltransferase